MTSQTIPVEPFDLVILGATGDLARRKILPALYLRARAGQLPTRGRIIGVARRAIDTDSYRRDSGEALKAALPERIGDAAVREAFLKRLHYLPVDATGDDGWGELATMLASEDEAVRVFYFAVAPGLFGTLASRIGERGLATGGARAVIEKPIGHDLVTANKVNEAVGQVFDEHQVFRIDHYLGKETVQNLMALRFANALFEPLWDAKWIDHVQITVAETVGVFGRGGYYDSAGALRDMVQNHLLQLLCLIALEPPSSFEADAIRDEKVKVLRALRPIGGREAGRLVARGQYCAADVGGEHLPGYLDDVGIPESGTETFVALRANIDNWRWAGVPFYLRTGKRLGRRVSEIVVSFKGVPLSIFGDEAGPLVSNRLVLRLQPDEGVRLEVMIKDPGPGGMRLRHVPLDMSFADEFGGSNPDAYERLLMDVIRGNQTLFMRRDEVDEAWRWIDPIRHACERTGTAPEPYPAGSWGPPSAIRMIEEGGRSWFGETET